MYSLTQLIYDVIRINFNGLQIRMINENALSMGIRNPNTSPVWIMYSDSGPSGETRTPGILLPKQARYQLRYTRIHPCIIAGDCASVQSAIVLLLKYNTVYKPSP